MSDPKPNLGASGEANKILSRYLRRPRTTFVISDPPIIEPIPETPFAETKLGKRAAATLRSQSFWKGFYWIPVPRSHQVLFAEALSQSLDAGIDIVDAVRTAADANPNFVFRAALQDMAWYVQTGMSLEEGLQLVRIRVSAELQIALEIGAERGCLSKQLDLFAQRYATFPGRKLAKALGHSYEVRRFAAVLAELLEDRRLTVSLVEDAGYLTAGRKSKFTQEILKVTEDMKGGREFAEALSTKVSSKVPSSFSPFFCRLISAASGREQLRNVLLRLAG